MIPGEKKAFYKFSNNDENVVSTKKQTNMHCENLIFDKILSE